MIRLFKNVSKHIFYSFFFIIHHKNQIHLKMQGKNRRFTIMLIVWYDNGIGYYFFDDKL